ncbi:MAG: Nramp family divalent metal transporter [Mycobacteriales bacterium]
MARGRWRGPIAVLGPAFVAAVAYVDPGNFATNFAAGSRFGYQLVWVVVLASAMATLVQYATAKLGIVRRESLPQLCGARFSRRTNAALWVQAEVVVMATDLAEFIGAAVGMHLVFGLPLLPAGLVTAVVSFVLLALQGRGYRRFELLIVAMLTVVAAGIGFVIAAGAAPPWSALGRGLAPDLGGHGAIGLAVGIVGATVMPHAVYLHSALHTDRINPADAGERRTLLRLNRADCLLGLGIAGLVNVAMLVVAATTLPGLGADFDLGSVHSRLGAALGGGAALAFGIALMASGLSSAAVGTYAGQVVMGGFVQRRIPLPIRRLITMLPALVALAVVTNLGQLLVWSQIVLSFGIPFALVPLALLTSDRSLMGASVNRRSTSVLLWLVAALVTAMNAFLVLGVFL